VNAGTLQVIDLIRCLLDRPSCDSWRIKDQLDVTCYFYFYS